MDTLVREAENAISLVVKDYLQQTDLRNITYPTLSVLRNRVLARQKLLKWAAKIGGQTVHYRSVTSPPSPASNNATIGANIPIGDIASTSAFDINLTESTQAAATATQSELRNLYLAKVGGAVDEIMSDLNRLIFVGDGTLVNSAGFIGLETIADPTLPYAGIDPDTYPAWSPVVVEASDGVTNRPLTVDLFLDMGLAMKEAKTNYDLIVTTPSIAKSYEQLFDTRRSFQVTGASPNQVDLAISNIAYNGRPIISDVECTPNTVYFLDSSKFLLHFYTVKGDAVQNGVAIKTTMVRANEPYVEGYELGIIPQLQCINRKAVSVLRNIA